MSPVRLAQCVQTLHGGGIVAYPTEAVWGLGCDPFNPVAVAHLLMLKKRPLCKGMIMVAASIDQIAPYFADLSAAQWRTLKSTWPGAVTWLVPVRPGGIPGWVRGQHATQAFRVSAHPVVSALCRRFGGPMVSTSANLAGHRPACSLFEVQCHLGAKIDMVMPGETGESLGPTPIRDLVTGDWLRA